MARHDSAPARREIAFDEVEIGAANAAGANADSNLAPARVRYWAVDEL
jgi:hypothetical protein